MEGYGQVTGELRAELRAEVTGYGQVTGRLRASYGRERAARAPQKPKDARPWAAEQSLCGGGGFQLQR